MSARDRPRKPTVRRGDDPRTEAARLLGEGLTASEVSRRLGVHERTVRRWRDNPASAPIIENARAMRAQAVADSVDEARRILRDAAPDAARAVVDALDSPDPADQLRAAAMLLDRVGVPRTERVETADVEHDFSALSPEERAQLRALLTKAESGPSVGHA